MIYQCSIKSNFDKMIKTARVFVFKMTTLSVVALGCSPASAENTLPHIVVILVDDMGYGDLSSYNPDSRIPTPNINRLAMEGMRFTDAHAGGPLCHPSRYALMTGQYPFRVDVSKWPVQSTIAEGQLTLPALLKNQGYLTSMVGKWHLGFQENGYDNPLPGGPVDRGFDTFFGIRASTDIPPYFYIRDNQAVEPPTDTIGANHSDGWSPIQGAFWRAGGIAPDLQLKDVLPRFTDEAIKVIIGHSQAGDDQPLMLYLAYPAPHTPWLPSAEFEGKSGAGMYGDFLMMVDHEIGRFINALKAADMYNETLLIFSSDNGPVWSDEDVERFGHDSSGGLRGMKGDAWEGGHRMPFIVRWQGKVAAGSSTDRLISFTDVLASLAEVTGQPERGIPPDSHSFLPVLLGESSTELEDRPPIVIKSASGAMVIRSGHWKLIDSLGSGGFTKPSRIKPEPNGPVGQLYNLADDPGESINLYLQRPEIVKRLEAEMEQIVDRNGS